MSSVNDKRYTGWGQRCTRLFYFCAKSLKNDWVKPLVWTWHFFQLFNLFEKMAGSWYSSSPCYVKYFGKGEVTLQLLFTEFCSLIMKLLGSSTLVMNWFCSRNIQKLILAKIVTKCWNLWVLKMWVPVFIDIS